MLFENVMPIDFFLMELYSAAASCIPCKLDPVQLRCFECASLMNAIFFDPIRMY